MKAQIIETESIHNKYGGLSGRRIWIVKHPDLSGGSVQAKSKAEAKQIKADLDAAVTVQQITAESNPSIWALLQPPQA